MEFKFDMLGALRKTAALKELPQAQRHILAQFVADKVTALKRKAASMKRGGQGRKTGQLARAIGSTLKASKDLSIATIGTNLKRETDVKYAKVQDEGGTIRAKNKQYLTIPLPGTQGRAADYKSVGAFVLKTKSGNLLIVAPTWGKRSKGGYGGSGYQRTGNLRALFLLKKEVYLPATRWFSGIMDGSEQELAELLSAEHQLKTAEGMAREGGI